MIVYGCVRVVFMCYSVLLFIALKHGFTCFDYVLYGCVCFSSVVLFCMVLLLFVMAL